MESLAGEYGHQEHQEDKVHGIRTLDGKQSSQNGGGSLESYATPRLHVR